MTRLISPARTLLLTASVLCAPFTAAALDGMRTLDPRDRVAVADTEPRERPRPTGDPAPVDVPGEIALDASVDESPDDALTFDGDELAARDAGTRAQTQGTGSTPTSGGEPAPGPPPEQGGQKEPPPPQPAPATAKPEPHWYEKLGLRGYTQFRFTRAETDEGPNLEVPADRSVNQNESFIIRRGRLILSGDVTERLSIYIQTDVMASTGASDYSLQIRDAYADYFLNHDKNFRLRFGQSKIPYGWVNMQSSQNRLPMERPEAINSAAETERDMGAFLMWETTEARHRFRDLTALGLKGSGDYGMVAVGAYAGQGPNRSDQNGDVHVLGRFSYPFKLTSGQFFELGVNGYYGKFVSPTAAISVDGRNITPTGPTDGIVDTRIGVTAVVYPQPIGIESEWNVGEGPELSDDFTTLQKRSLNGGYVLVSYRSTHPFTWIPFARWNYYDGGRKFARNAPNMRVKEVDLGLEFARFADLEVTVMYSHTFERTRTGSFSYSLSKNANRIGLQVQWNY